MAKRMTDTDKWKKRFVRELKPQHKLLWFYILDDCNHAGIWEVDIDVASIRVGFDLSGDDLPNLFGEKVIEFDGGDKWFLPDFIDFQYGELNPNSNVHKSVIALLDKYNLQGYIKGSQGVQSTLINKDKDIVIVKDKVKAKRFVKPTVDEVLDYCNERQNLVDAQKFYDFYESNGWKVGKNSMKDWKASVRTWEKNTSSSKKSQPKEVLTAWQQARNVINNGQ
tara:strand:- start:2436 stop:3104 length:669 start_codon:yes stop_codon:yes gene_type:complete